MYYKKTVTVNDRIFVTKCKMPMLGNSLKRLKKNVSSKAIEKFNIRRAIEKVFYLLLLNFSPGDMHIIFTYKRGTVQDGNEAKKKFQNFLRRYKSYCKKNGYKYDYIYNTEVGKRGAYHHHCILHHHGDERTLSKIWGDNGKVIIHSYLWPNYDWYGLAEYFVDCTKGGKLPNRHIKFGRRYIPSKSLIKPIVRIEKIRAKKWQKPKAPDGYIIIWDSVRTGLHELSGGAFIKYEMRRKI